MASLRRALPSLARCERPRKALSRFCQDQPGRLAHGPEEKKGLTGRLVGFVVEVISPTLPDRMPLVGEGWPAAGMLENARKVKNTPGTGARQSLPRLNGAPGRRRRRTGSLGQPTTVWRQAAFFCAAALPPMACGVAWQPRPSAPPVARRLARAHHTLARDSVDACRCRG